MTYKSIQVTATEWDLARVNGSGVVVKTVATFYGNPGLCAAVADFLNERDAAALDGASGEPGAVIAAPGPGAGEGL